MAKASVTIKCKACGTEFRHTRICGNRMEADSYEEWAKHNVDMCPECHRKAQEEEKAEKENAIIGDIRLTELTGSEKQIAWAIKIRRSFLASRIKRLADANRPIDDLIAAVNEKTEAAFWIDNRDKF